MLCVRALVRALNDAINYAQQGCAMQFSGITLMAGYKPENVWNMDETGQFWKALPDKSLSERGWQASKAKINVGILCKRIR